MTQRKNKSTEDRISHEFAARLANFDPQKKIRAIILMSTKNTGEFPKQRINRNQRQVAIKRIQKSAEQALDNIDKTLESFGGQRLSSSPDALGSITVETTAPGILALASSNWVKTIFEDQGIYPIK